MTVDAKLVALVQDQLELPVEDRLRVLLDDRWPACIDALRAAAELSESAIVVGPVAAALVGAPHRLTGRVDVLIDYDDRHDVDDRFFDRGAQPAGVRMAGPSFPNDRRAYWTVGAGTLTVRISRDVNVGELRLRARVIEAPSFGVLRVPWTEDLLRLSESSAWSEEHVYVPSLRAVLACNRG